MSATLQAPAIRAGIGRGRSIVRPDLTAIAVWVLAGAIVVYLGLDGGGYDLVVRNQVGLIVWWAILIAAAAGLLPAATRLTRSGWVSLALLGGFVLWTALASTWSHSSERSLAELSRVACYLGIFLLAITIYRDRDKALRHTVAAIASAIAFVAAVALLSRLRPGTFAAADQSASYLPGTQGRLGWPINYWNGLAALVALGLPLLLAVATSARRLWAQALAAAALPMVALCGYLTFSRGGALAAGVALIAFFFVTGDRIPKLATALVAAAGSAILIAGAVHRHGVQDGLVNAVARHQGNQLLIAVVLVCAGTAIVQVGIGLATRHGTLPKLLRVSRRRAGLLLAAALACGIIAALAAGAPSRLSHAWNDFKRTNATALHSTGISRFGSASGNGRYQYWRVAVHASRQHLLTGWGPGTFPLVWLPHSTNDDYVQNAHSLYVETLLEDGLIGLALIVGLFVLVIGRAATVAWRARYEARTYGAAATAACLAFAVSAAVDWVWQIPVLPVCFLLLAAAVFAPRRGAGAAPMPSWGRWLMRGAMVLAALACLVAIVVPLSTTNAVRASQTAAASGNYPEALSYARAATSIEPGAASAQLQTALVLELEGKLGAAVQAAHNATTDEPLNWESWLVLSRLKTETGHPLAALRAYRQARSLNPHSTLFRS